MESSGEHSHFSKHLGSYGKADTPVLAVMLIVSTTVSYKADSLYLETEARRVWFAVLKKIRFNSPLH